MRSSVGIQYGWAAYVGNLGGGQESGLAVAGEVVDVDISVEQGFLDVTDMSTPLALVRAPTSVMTTITARMARAKMIRGKHANEAFRDVLDTWPEPDEGDGRHRRKWPPSMRAMAELARRHPEEYEKLHAAEIAAEPLLVVRHGWVTGS